VLWQVPWKQKVCRVNVHGGIGSRLASLVLAAFFLILSSVVGSAAQEGSSSRESSDQVSVPGNQAWTNTNLSVKRGERLIIGEEPGSAKEPSSVRIRKGPWLLGVRANVTARGSYVLETRDHDFPLPAFLDDARYPAYCLIGRIGEKGDPFYIGSRYDANAPASGELWLGINDPNPARNQGRFLCKVTRGATGSPQAAVPLRVAPDKGVPAPMSDANVVIFYLDGVRPDVLLEMAGMGHLPTFEKTFLSGGTYASNAFCVLPSLTQTNFTSMMTGTFSDKHAIKMQYYYNRETNRMADDLYRNAYGRVARRVRRTGVKALYDYFPGAFGATGLPMQRRSPEVLEANLVEWLHRCINVSNYMSNMRPKMDESDARFGLDLASFPEVKVMVIWFPQTDIQDELCAHGQFGRSRAALAKMDDCMAQIIHRLQIRGRLDKTYFVAFSDHGKACGDSFVNQSFDLAREILHPHFHLNMRSRFGLFGCPGAPRSHLAMASDEDGVTEISLPHGRADSGDLSQPNLLSDLLNYQLADGRRLNALDVFTEYTSQGRIAAADLPRKPVDFAVARSDSNTVFLQRTARSQAFITWRRRSGGELEFKYEPVRNYVLDGELERLTSGDPLAYLDSKEFAAAVSREGATVAGWLDKFHTGREWLKVTAGTDYPGCIDGISRFFAYEDTKRERNLPDIALFAGRGWVFLPKTAMDRREQVAAGARHGMAFKESTHMCMFFSGPGVARGRVIEEPHRIVDVLPTVLTMMSKEWKAEGLDGIPVNGIWGGE